MVFWGAAAVAALTVGVLNANFAPDSCFIEVRNWLRVWRAGANLYTLIPPVVDYPPNAIVLFTPMSFFIGSTGEFWFALFNAAVCVVAAWLLVSLMTRLTGVDLMRPERAVYTLMLLSFAPVRVSIWNGQTTPLILMCCCLSARLWRTSAAASGVALGFGIAKPHVALPFAFAALFARRWRVLSVAVGTAVSMALAYCATVRENPLAVLKQYVATLNGVYAGPHFVRGEVDMRPMFVDALRRYGIGETAYVAAALLIASAFFWLAWRARRNAAAVANVLAAGCVAALAIFPFRRYGLLLIAPILLLLLWRRSTTRAESTVLATVIAIEVLDVPFLARHAMQWYFTPSLTIMQAPNYINRVVVLILLAMAMISLERAGRQQRTGRDIIGSSSGAGAATRYATLMERFPGR